MKTKILIPFLFLLLSLKAYCQSKTLTISFENLTLQECISKIEGQEHYNFFYEESWFNAPNNIVINKTYENSTIEEVLGSLFSETNLNFFIKNKSIFLTKNIAIFNNFEILETKKDSTIVNEIATISSIQKEAPQTNNSIQKITLGKENFKTQKQKVKLKGKLVNTVTNSPIDNLVLKCGDKIAYSDFEGNFSLELTKGKNIIEVKSLNYETTTLEVTIYSDAEHTFFLHEKINFLNEIILTKNLNNNLNSSTTGKVTYTAEEIKNIPMVLGERDIIKVTTTMPGFKTAGEGSSGINVRGGRTDQNLFLLDNATIYNPTHLFGLFSSVNPYIVSNVNVYKSGIPAEYGGRLSSVFDISTKSKIESKINGEGSIGPVTGNLMVKTPIIKEKSDLMIAARSSYSDWILKSLDNEDLKNSKASFYDLYLKYSHKINPKNRVDVSSYLSNDNFNISKDSLYNHKNSFISVRWSNEINDKTDLNVFYSYSNYRFNLEYNGLFDDSFDYLFRIRQNEVGAKLNKNVSEKIKISYGLSSKLYNLNPGELSPKDENSILQSINIQKEKGLESGIYFSTIYNLNEDLTINSGVRISNYLALGERTVNLYDSNYPRDESSLLESKQYANNDIIKSYYGFEPRLSLRYKITENIAVKGSYDRTNQYIHLMSSNTTQSPLDTWKTSDNNIKPQNADQFSVGIYSNLFQSNLELSLESYYKKIHNILDYKTGADLFLNSSIETELLSGKGKAYGIEFLVKKQVGKLNGFLGYTYSRTFVKIQSQFPQDQINNGEYYPANFDKPHDLSLVLNYKFTQRYSFSMNFNYQTGRPITYPVGKYVFSNSEYVLYSDRNAFRIPDYYRLDVGVNIEGNHKRKKLAHSFWNFSIYNLLGRNNPYSIYFVTENGDVKAYKTSIFSIPIPTLTYNFKF